MFVKSLVVLSAFIALTWAQCNIGCYQQGFVNAGEEYHTMDNITDVNICVEECRRRGNCQFWSYWIPKERCEIWYSCSEFQVGPETVSGNRNCGDIVCNADGICRGLVIDHAIEAKSHYDCYYACKDFVDPDGNDFCNYYTWDEIGICTLYEDCDTNNLDTQCIDCTTGSPICPPPANGTLFFF